MITLSISLKIHYSQGFRHVGTGEIPLSIFQKTISLLFFNNRPIVPWQLSCHLLILSGKPRLSYGCELTISSTYIMFQFLTLYSLELMKTNGKQAVQPKKAIPNYIKMSKFQVQVLRVLVFSLYVSLKLTQDCLNSLIQH